MIRTRPTLTMYLYSTMALLPCPRVCEPPRVCWKTKAELGMPGSWKTSRDSAIHWSRYGICLSAENVSTRTTSHIWSEEFRTTRQSWRVYGLSRMAWSSRARSSEWLRTLSRYDRSYDITLTWKTGQANTRYRIRRTLSTSTIAPFSYVSVFVMSSYTSNRLNTTSPVWPRIGLKSVSSMARCSPITGAGCWTSLMACRLGTRALRRFVCLPRRFVWTKQTRARLWA